MNKIIRFVYNWTSTLLEPKRIISAIPGYFWYTRDWIKYATSPGAERIGITDTHPIFMDKTSSTPFDPHYLYQANWAFRKIQESKAKSHVDVGSDIRFVSLLGAITDVEFVDIRPLDIDVEGFRCKEGSVVNLPYADNSVKSLSCLHVVEHVGLGRYGDPVDPSGTVKSVKEIQRVLSPGGNLYFSVPVGKARVCFNANKVFSPKQIVDYFSGLTLVEFTGVKDDKSFIRNASLEQMGNEDYGCGMFHFKKE
jgi:hypothetical protein